MTYPDMLLHIDTYPTPTTDESIEAAISLASSLDGKLTGLGIEVDIPVRSNRLADYLIGLSAMAVEEEAKSRRACRDGLASFTTKATTAGVFRASIAARVNHFEVAEHVAKAARTYDLCLLPFAAGYNGQREIAQEVVFSSGRPALIFLPGTAAGLAKGPGVVVVAWDGSRSAARAMADALPILSRAEQVRVLTILDEKPDVTASMGTEAQRHLQAHGVTAVVDSVDAGGLSIGKVLDRYLEQHAPDLLVMGAYGHSRAREFLLGGATEHTLKHPLCPVFFSH